MMSPAGFRSKNPTGRRISFSKTCWRRWKANRFEMRSMVTLMTMLRTEEET